jgi:hypothetical protein
MLSVRWQQALLPTLSPPVVALWLLYLYATVARWLHQSQERQDAGRKLAATASKTRKLTGEREEAIAVP